MISAIITKIVNLPILDLKNHTIFHSESVENCAIWRKKEIL